MENIRLDFEFTPYAGTAEWVKLVKAYNEVTHDVNVLCEQGMDPSDTLVSLQDQLWKEIIMQLEAEYGDDHEVICHALNDNGVLAHSDPRLDPRDKVGGVVCPF